MNEWITYMTEHLPSMMDILWAMYIHDGVIKWKHFPQYWLLVRGIHRWPVNSPHKCQWRGALIFSLIWAWINGWVNNRKAGCLRRHRAHYAVTVMNKSYHIHTVLSCFVLLCHCVLLGRFVECNIFTQNVQDCFTGTEEMSTHIAGIFPVCSTVVHQVDITENTTASHDRRTCEGSPVSARHWFLGGKIYITLTSWWPWWRLKSPASRLFTQPFIQRQIKENTKAPRHWPLCGEFTGTGDFPAQKASYAENVSIWWRHHVKFNVMCIYVLFFLSACSNEFKNVNTECFDIFCSVVWALFLANKYRHVMMDITR